MRVLGPTGAEAGPNTQARFPGQPGYLALSTARFCLLVFSR